MGEPSFLDKLTKRNERRNNHESNFPSIELMSRVMVEISRQFPEVDMALVGSSVANRERLAREPSDVDVVLFTFSKSEFEGAKALIESSLTQLGVNKVDVMFNVGVAVTKPHVRIMNGAIISQSDIGDGSYFQQRGGNKTT